MKATFREPRFMELNSHPHSYGIFIGGNDMGTEQMSPRVLRRVRQTAMRSFADSAARRCSRCSGTSPNAAVHKAPGVGQPVTQEIAWHVKGGRAECSINGMVVAGYDKAELVAAGKLRSIDGVFGTALHTQRRSGDHRLRRDEGRELYSGP